MPWTTAPWGLPPEQVLERLGSSPAGLNAAEVARRLVEDGPNAVAWMLLVAAILVAYFLAAETAKRRYYRRPATASLTKP